MNRSVAEYSPTLALHVSSSAALPTADVPGQPDGQQAERGGGQHQRCPGLLHQQPLRHRHARGQLPPREPGHRRGGRRRRRRRERDSNQHLGHHIVRLSRVRTAPTAPRPPRPLLRVTLNSRPGQISFLNCRLFFSDFLKTFLLTQTVSTSVTRGRRSCGSSKLCGSLCTTFSRRELILSQCSVSERSCSSNIPRRNRVVVPVSSSLLEWRTSLFPGSLF